MTGVARRALSALARRIWNDPTADTEKRQLARGVLMLLEGGLPR